MVPCNKSEIKYQNNCDNKNLNYQNVNKISNFSIDHILNKAGEQFNNYRINNEINYFKCNSSDKICNCNKIVKNNNNNRNNKIIFPIFDWLNYTRYKPPKLTRSFHNGPIKRTPGRLPRVPFTKAQLDALEESYKKSNYVNSVEANKLAVELHLTNTRVKIWFQNRRAREKKEKREIDINLNNNVNMFPTTILNNFQHVNDRNFT